MCFHARQTMLALELASKYHVGFDGKIDISEYDYEHYHANGYAHPIMHTITQEKPNIITPSTWGIMPENEAWANSKEYYKKAVKFGAGLNARSEKLFNHFIYSRSALTRRCIVPVDGFFEPHTAPNNLKIPFYFERNNEDIMSLAGLYSITKDGFNTFTILTKEATPLFRKIHNSKNRRPVILNDCDIDVWLDGNLKEDEVLDVIEQDLEDSEIKAYPVSRELFSPKKDSNRADIIEKIDYSEIEIEY